MWKARLLILPAVVCAFVFGVVAKSYYDELQKPNCSQEDMCSVDYRNGEWHIEEREPGTY